MSNKPICAIQGPIFNRSGYGDWATDVAKSVVRYNKFDVRVIPTKWGSCPSKTKFEDLYTDEDRALATKFIKEPLNRQPDLFIQLSIPNEFQPVGKYNIGMTAGIETTAASGDFIDGLNRMNMNIVTSVHSKKVFESADYVKQFQDGRKEALKSTKPIEVCLWGADTTIYGKNVVVESARLNEELDQIPEKFLFLFVGQWTHGGDVFSDRKDIGNLVKTFLTAFKNKPDAPGLLLKTSGAVLSKTDKDEILKKIDFVRNTIDAKSLPNIYLLHGELTDKEMNQLFNHSKVKIHVSFTHGEGYGHPLLLASLSGKPVVASNWSGHLDFLNPSYTTFFEGTIRPIGHSSVNEWLIKESSWFYVSYSLAEDKLKKLHSNYKSDSKILENAEKLRVENEQKFSLQAMDARLHALLDKYVPTFAVETTLILPNKLKKIELPKLAGM